MLEEADFSALQSDTHLLSDLVYRAIRVKASIVERDERESGDRRLLNLGHTLAHAIEKSSSKFNHGEAVACGLNLVAEAACKRGELSAEVCDRIRNLLLRAGFQLEPPVAMSRLLKEVSKDKKAEGTAIHVVFPQDIGHCVVEKMAVEEFKAMFK